MIRVAPAVPIDIVEQEMTIKGWFDFSKWSRVTDREIAWLQCELANLYPHNEAIAPAWCDDPFGDLDGRWN